MAPRLPLELVERIIDDVAEYDDNHIDKFSSIKACALVCHYFLPLCRKYIFASVILNTAQRLSPPTSDDLNHLLSNSPHLAVYIRKLDYNVDKEEFVAERFIWLLPMFKKLIKLQKLSIISMRSGSGKLDWMSSSERNVLLPLLHLPTLTSISLSSIRNFPFADLANCVNLKKLRIQYLECSTPNGAGKFLEALSPTPVMLERLTIEAGINPVQHLYHARRPDGIPVIDFSTLKEIKSRDVLLCSMTELFGMCKNLQKVSFDMHEASLDYSGCLTGLFIMLKPSLSTLVDIYIECSIDDENALSDGPLCGLCHELEKMVGQNVVETIKLMISVYPCSDWTRCTGWGELDDVLMGSPEGWPALRKVSLSVNVVGIYTGGLVEGLQESYMTKLMESKRVQFDLRISINNIQVAQAFSSSVQVG